MSKQMPLQILRVFAWVDLIASIIGAIWIWSQFGKSEVVYSLGHFLTNPLGIAIGIAVLLQGIFSCAFFSVIASIGEKLIVIKEYLDIIFVKEYLDKKGKKCPQCAEEVRVEARVCRFCWYNFDLRAPKYVSIETVVPFHRDGASENQGRK